MNFEIPNYNLNGLVHANVIIGKNGVGKSRLLRELYISCQSKNEEYFVKYIVPERGGNIEYDGTYEMNEKNNKNWILESQKKNRFDKFRNGSHNIYRNLELLVLRKKEKDNSSITFDRVLSDLNRLLENIDITRDATTDPIFVSKSDKTRITADSISSGESELISLAIEVLHFCYLSDHEENRGKSKFLILDEPDVHLHPDLQVRFMEFVEEATKRHGIRIVIATHSTCILSGIARANARVAFMQRGQKTLKFVDIDASLAAVMPVFGAHPLTSVFNEMPIFLLEGEDDVRIWQTAVRASSGRLKIWPCAAGDVQSLSRYERTASEILGAIYDNPRGYSLRDRDDVGGDIEDMGPIIRSKLSCRAAENLLLTDQVLSRLGSSWPEVQKALEQWVCDKPSHPQSKDIINFENSNWDRRNFNIKSIRNVIMAVAGSEKPWEVAIGQSIADLFNKGDDTGEYSLSSFLGQKLVKVLGLVDK